MTRVNIVPPKELSDKHLIAEYREITRLPNYLKKSLNRKSKPFSEAEIPQKYTMGTGHVKFFYNKMRYLKARYKAILDEMDIRGFKSTFRDLSVFDVDNDAFMQHYSPDEEALSINRARIAERS